MCDADAVILLRISVVAWPPNTGGERHTETREARHVWLHSETLLLDCRPIVSPASRPPRRRQINPPEIADSQHGSPAEAKVPGEACPEALGNELKHQRTTTQPASTIAPPTPTLPPSRHLSTHTYTHSLTTPIAPPTTITTPHPRGKFCFSSVITTSTQFILRAPPKPHPTHTRLLALPKSCRTRPGTPTPAAPASDFDTREHVYIDPRDQFAWPLLPSNVPPAQGKIVRFLTKSAQKRCSPNNSRRTTSPSLRHTYGLASCQQSNLS